MAAAAAPAAPDVNVFANTILRRLRRPDIAAADAAPDAAVRDVNVLANAILLDTLRNVVRGDGTHYRIRNFYTHRSVLNRLQNFLIANRLVSEIPLGQFWWAPIERTQYGEPARYTAIIDRPVIPDGWRILGDILPIGPVLPEEWFVGGGYYLWQVYFNVPRFHHVGLKDLTYNDLLWGDDMGFLCDELEFGFDEHTSKIAFSMILRGYRFP